MRKIKEILRLHHELGLARREIGRSRLGLPQHRGRRHPASRGGRSFLAASRGPRRGRSRRPALPADRALFGAAARARSRADAPGTRPQRGDPAAALARIQGRAPGRPAVHPVLRALPALRGKVDVVLRQRAQGRGEALRGLRRAHGPHRGSPRPAKCETAHIFVAVLGCSNYTYTEATWGEDLRSWLSAHVRTVRGARRGGPHPGLRQPEERRHATPTTTSPISTPPMPISPAITAARSCPARPRRPRDKAKVEAGVLVVERSILAPLRDRTFFSLPELNDALAAGTARLNEAPFQKLAGSRRSLFETLGSPGAPPPAPHPL